MAAFTIQTLQFRDRRGHVPNRKEPAWNEATWIGATPFVNVPIVVCAKVRQRQRLVLGHYKQPAVNRGEACEIQRRSDAVDIHVRNSGVNVVATRPKLLERGRLHAILLRRPANNSIEAYRRELPALIFPIVSAV